MGSKSFFSSSSIMVFFSVFKRINLKRKYGSADATKIILKMIAKFKIIF